MGELDLIQRIVIWILPVVLAITVHEVAHGWVAKLFGDTSAQQAGRLTLNPIPHIDPVGTLLVPAMLLISTALLQTGMFVFGWAKPVPVSWQRLRRPKQDMAYVAAAGPAANLVMALLWGLFAHLMIRVLAGGSEVVVPLVLMGVAGIFINAILMVLNMLPLLPLDGGRVVTSLLPVNMAVKFARMEPYGLVILLALLFTGMLQWILGPPLMWVLALLSTTTGLSGAQYLGLLQVLMGH